MVTHDRDELWSDWYDSKTAGGLHRYQHGLPVAVRLGVDAGGDVQDGRVEIQAVRSVAFASSPPMRTRTRYFTRPDASRRS
jgi:hypothetical protein